MMTISFAGLFSRKQRSAKRAAKNQVRETKKLLRRGRDGVDTQTHERIRVLTVVLTAAIKKETHEQLNRLTQTLANQTDKHLGDYRKPPWRESLESVCVAILVALVLRSFVVEAFKIPSGSMIPTLAIGDQIFVNKYIYGARIPFTSIRLIDFGAPKRGEVVVFICPIPPHDDYIKRVIGIPGDEIFVHAGTIYINGEPVPRRATGTSRFADRDTDGVWTLFGAETFEETLGEHTYTVLHDVDVPGLPQDFGPVIVPKDRLFAMGDNRDHSYDSRSWGFVPLSSVLGRSQFVWWSWGRDGLDAKRIGTWID